ncbi:hypothetical protein V7161_00025 [Neobacillus drentensis]|uniref:hypothetical protein n=1 Tax=Neobacillus drentensis TaxID=220684 RepID=UPI002FFECC16
MEEGKLKFLVEFITFKDYKRQINLERQKDGGSMSKEVHFFATKADLETGLKELELYRKVKYVRAGLFDQMEVPVYTSYSEIIDFGINHSGDHISERYLVLDQNFELKIEEVPQQRGGLKFAVDQLINGSSIVFWPGGIHKESFLICGHISTSSKENISLELYKDFRKKVLKGFKKIGSYYCGLEALQMKDEVRFITIGIHQDKLYDLKI